VLMRDLLSYLMRATCLSISLVLLFISVTTSPVLAQKLSVDRSTPSTTSPPCEAAAATNASSLRSTPPAQAESEFKNPPHVYDMKSIRAFDRQVYQTGEQQPESSGD
ncbi:MAG: hypothetical protein AAF974_02740, partial [Cyanobacteria bacterium P01_E01_bin.34]